jgi:sigma-B regulation protein RsbU (phosphoserine phosphatase)
MTSESTVPAKPNLSHSGLQALLESARLLNASATLDELLSHLIRTVMGRLLVTRGVIAIEDDVEGHRAMRVELARGVSGIAKGSILTDEAAAGAKLELRYPIGTADGPVGVLALGKPALGAPSAEQLELLQALLELAAIAIAKARAHEHTVQVNRSLDQSLQELRAIVDLARGLAAKTEAGEVAHLLALTLAGRWTVRKHAVAAWRDGHAPTTRQRGIVLPDIAMLRTMAAALTEPAYTPESLPDDVRAALQVEAGAIVFPIRTGEVTMGIVICGPRMAGKPYAASDIEFGAGLIAQAAVAFENAWRMEEILRRQQIEQELAIAASIQESLFPSKLPALFASDIAARNRQARQVGGDYYDVLRLGGTPGRHLLCVADISGKGLPAALLMSNIQATLRAITRTPTPLAELATMTNALLFASTPSNRFATAFLLDYDPETGASVYVNCGHNDGIVLRRDGTVELLTTTGLPVGLFAKAAYEEGRVELAPGDLLMLYSDGVPEASDIHEQDFGMERVIEVLKSHRDLPAAELADLMIKQIDAFVGTAPQFDDITLMVMKRL